jgi:hypothetical protein
MPLMFTVMGALSASPDASTPDQAYRRGSVMMWTCGARSDLRLV